MARLTADKTVLFIDLDAGKTFADATVTYDGEGSVVNMWQRVRGANLGATPSPWTSVFLPPENGANWAGEFGITVHAGMVREFGLLPEEGVTPSQSASPRGRHS